VRSEERIDQFDHSVVLGVELERIIDADDDVVTLSGPRDRGGSSDPRAGAARLRLKVDVHVESLS
jgi:hypothetical protein